MSLGELPVYVQARRHRPTWLQSFLYEASQDGAAELTRGDRKRQEQTARATVAELVGPHLPLPHPLLAKVYAMAVGDLVYELGLWLKSCALICCKCPEPHIDSSFFFGGRHSKARIIGPTTPSNEERVKTAEAIPLVTPIDDGLVPCAEFFKEPRLVDQTKNGSREKFDKRVCFTYRTAVIRELLRHSEVDEPVSKENLWMTHTRIWDLFADVTKSGCLHLADLLWTHSPAVRLSTFAERRQLMHDLACAPFYGATFHWLVRRFGDLDHAEHENRSLQPPLGATHLGAIRSAEEAYHAYLLNLSGSPICIGMTIGAAQGVLLNLSTCASFGTLQHLARTYPSIDWIHKAFLDSAGMRDRRPVDCAVAHSNLDFFDWLYDHAVTDATLKPVTADTVDHARLMQSVARSMRAIRDK